MKNKILIYLFLFAATQPLTAYSTPINTSAATSIETGQILWNQKFEYKSTKRSCASCHTSDPTVAGKHIRTRKPIKAMARSINPERFSDPKKVAKWYKRNCKWTLGRECTTQEKSDIENYLNSL